MPKLPKDQHEIIAADPQYGSISYYNDPIDPPRFGKGGKAGKAVGVAEELGKLYSEAEAQIAAEKAAKGKFPIELKRAKPLTQQQIIEHADRVARQQAGEHVTSGKPKDTKNLAGRSMKEVKRLQDLEYTLQPTTELRPTPIYEGKVGDINIALPGDQTIADQLLLDVNGLPIESTQEGGSLYGEGKLHLDDPLFWASGRQIAQMFQNKVDDLARLYNTDDIMAHHLAMGPVSNNYAMHFADANLRAIANTDMKKKDIKAFNNIIRDGYVDPKGNRIRLDHFVGIENPEEAAVQMMEDPALRKWFNNRMKVPKITESLGMPNGLDIQWAITEPELRNMEVNLTGHSVGKMKPFAELTDTANHNTYEAGIQGISLGHAPELAPFEVSFPDASDYVKATQRPQDFTGTIQKVFPHQVVDQQQLDQMAEYYRRLREIRGFAKGGKIGRAAGILEELSKLSKVAEGEIAAEKAAKLPTFAPVTESKPLSFDEFMMSRFPAARDPERVKDYYRQYLNEEFINENNFADGGWSSKHAQPKAEPANAKKLEIPSWEKLRRTGKLAGKQIAKELTAESPKQTAIDIAGDLAASTLGFPADIANTSYEPVKGSEKFKAKNPTPFGLSEESKVIPREEGIPIASTENFKRMLQENGIISGTERPLTEGLVTLASPAALAKAPKALSTMGKLVKELEGLPAGMSIKDVSQGVQFVSPLEKTVNSHKMESMPGNQWSAWLSANAPKGAKKEAEASGLHDWLKTQGKVSKEEIGAFLDENRPQVQAVIKERPRDLNREEHARLRELQNLTKSFEPFNSNMTPEQYDEYMRLSNIAEKSDPQTLKTAIKTSEKQLAWANENGYIPNAISAEHRIAHLNDRLKQLEESGKTFDFPKYSSYVEPSGKNYRETLVTLPSKHTPEFVYDVHGYSPKAGFATREEAQAYADEQNNLPAELREKLKDVDPSVRDAMEKAISNMEDFPHQVLESEMPTSRAKNPDYLGSHWREPNVVAHLRTNQRSTPSGKKALHIEELQSDWGQQGRERGFKEKPLTTDDVETMTIHPSDKETLRNIGLDTWDEYSNKFRAENNIPLDTPYVAYRLKGHPDNEKMYGSWSLAWNGKTPEEVAQQVIKTPSTENTVFGVANRKREEGLPSGPYVKDTKDWTALGLKHALKQAVDEGHDYLTFATGKQNADRYDLSKQIKDIHYEPQDDGTFDIQAIGHDGDAVMDEEYVPKEKLSDYVGKELADKIIEDKGRLKGGEGGYRNWRTLSGVDLEIGGEGMKAYYDQIIPQTMKDVLKQIGSSEKVKPIDIFMDDDWVPHMGIEITPELRDKVLNEGLPHFKKGGKITKSNLEDEFKLNRYMR